MRVVTDGAGQRPAAAGSALRHIKETNARALGAGKAILRRVDLIVLQQLAIAFGLGLLLGLQRERAESSIGGIRTFPLIAIFGTICAQLEKSFGGWVIAAGLLALVAIVIYSNFAKMKSGAIDPGMTTEVAALLLYGLGAYVVVGNMVIAVVVGGAMAVLLHFKKPLHELAGAIGEHDMRAIMQFVLLSLVILPVLPNQDLGPYGVWNPFQIWLMVVLIVGISLSGYIAYKILGARAGTLLAGILGGLISSTATTVSYARRTAENASLASLAAFVIMIASCVSLGSRSGRGGGGGSSVVCLARPAPHGDAGRGPPHRHDNVFLAAFARLEDAGAKKSCGTKDGVCLRRGLRTRASGRGRGEGAFRFRWSLHRGRDFRPDRHGCHHPFLGAIGGKRTHRSFHRLACDPGCRAVELRLQIRDGCSPWRPLLNSPCRRRL